jgi:hypothetical protein
MALFLRQPRRTTSTEAESTRLRSVELRPTLRVIEKARGLMTPLIGASRTQELIQGAMQVEHIERMRELAPLLQLG